jgi:hypothetical protein
MGVGSATVWSIRVPPDDELDETAEAIALVGAVSSFMPDW